MLHKDPKKRPTIEQVKKDQFFAGINWVLLAQKRYRPPTKLDKLPDKDASAGAGEDDMFANGIAKKSGNESGAFKDKDYTETNKTYNRVRNYSFSREEQSKTTNATKVQR